MIDWFDLAANALWILAYALALRPSATPVGRVRTGMRIYVKSWHYRNTKHL